jgi:heavy metal translocating P-type ATPase
MRIRFAPLFITLVALMAGAVASLTGAASTGHAIWLVGAISMGLPLVLRTIRGAIAGRFATDIVASLSIAGAIALGQPLVALVIVVMQTGGEALEHYAEGRASAAVRELEAAAPRGAHLVRDGQVEEVPATSVTVGDVLLVRPGDLVPCDGVIVSGESELDTSSLTGESLPLRATVGTVVMSGMANALGSFHMRVTAPAERSQYARIVEAVRSAQSSKAPLQRLADQYAVWFTPITIGLCAIAIAVTRDWTRVLAILVVATPCPLILATPVAIIGGINRAAKRFIIIRHGGALERLSEADAAVFDKTGTITVGKPRLHDVLAASGFERTTVLRSAAAVEEHSSHLLARVLVDAAKTEGLSIAESSGHAETPGQGVLGTVDGRVVRVGSRAFVVPRCIGGSDAALPFDRLDSTLRAYVSIDDNLAGVIEYADELRAELPAVLASLRRSGVRRLVLLSGDHERIVHALADRAGISEAHGDLLPADKVRFIEQLKREGHVVMMVGDGINDAPALSSADIGIALAAHGGGITAEAADVVLLVDSLDRVGEAMSISRRTMRIARQSIWVGLGLSAAAMVIAALGALPPLAGAAIQEVIDVAVIVNALRTSMTPRDDSTSHPSSPARTTPTATLRAIRRALPSALSAHTTR